MNSNEKRGEFCMESGEPVYQTKDDSFKTLLVRFFSIYWRSIILVIWPLVLLPALLINDAPMYRCLYVVAVMAMYWVTEVLPLPITGIIPVVLYPLMGILDTGDTCRCYFNDTTMMFIGSLVIAVAVEHSGLHMRIALLIIKLIGCSHRKLSLGLFFVTMFISMWISNTAATAMMIPIIETVLMELESQGLGTMFIVEKNALEDEDGEEKKIPTHSTMAYYFAAAYASSIGGIGTIVGTGTNLTLKGIFEIRFPDSPGLSFTSWMLYAVPSMLLMSFLTWLWLQVMYMGLFRPKSEDARAIDIGEEGERVAVAVIEKRYKELGPITWHESCVGVCFFIVILLWFFRKPGFVTGWPSYITDLQVSNMTISASAAQLVSFIGINFISIYRAVKDSTAAIFITILFFAIPSKLDFLNAFSKDPRKRPKKPSPSILNWNLINHRMHWGLMLVLGGGFAIASGSSTSGLSSTLGASLDGLKSLNVVVILFIICLFTETVTELTANVAVANIILPVLMEMCVAIKVHPLYLMVPATMCCSFSFHMPVGTPPNAIASAAGYIKTKDFIIAGIGPSFITLIVTTVAFSTWGMYVFDLHEFPDWATS